MKNLLTIALLCVMAGCASKKDKEYNRLQKSFDSLYVLNDSLSNEFNKSSDSNQFIIYEQQVKNHTKMVEITVKMLEVNK